MSRPAADDGIPLTDSAWSIYDARAFTVGNSETVHLLANFPKFWLVRGRCGVIGYAMDYATTRRAQWASGYDGPPECETCKRADYRGAL